MRGGFACGFCRRAELLGRTGKGDIGHLHRNGSYPAGRLHNLENAQKNVLLDGSELDWISGTHINEGWPDRSSLGRLVGSKIMSTCVAAGLAIMRKLALPGCRVRDALVVTVG
jgi:hypothetical protein